MKIGLIDVDSHNFPNIPLMKISAYHKAIGDTVEYEATEIIDEQPTVDAVEVVHGRWEPRKDVLGFVRCSACHNCNIYDDWPDGKKWNYCPNCGAKMDGERREV